MAAKVLKSFLIGVGYDTKGLDEGDKKIQSSLQGVKTGALGLSAAFVGAFGLVAASVNNTASRVDQLALQTQNLRTSTNDVYNYGNAIRFMGGEASEALDALSRFEEIQNNLRLKGDAGPIQDLATAGIDVQPLYATSTGEEFLFELARQVPGLDKAQSAQVQSSLGLSDAAFKSLSGGVDNLNKLITSANQATGDIDQLIDDSRKLRQSTVAITLAIEGVANKLATAFLPDIANAAEAVSKFTIEVGKFIAGETEAGQAFAQSGATGLLGFGAESAGAKEGGSALRAAGLILDQTPGSTLLEMGIPGVKQAGQIYDYLFGGRSASDAVSKPNQDAIEADRQANADAMAGAIGRSPLKVESTLNATIQIDGQALESKIIDVNERTSYETLGDLKTTTER